MPLTFEIHARAADCHARLGRVATPHGAFDTPAFMPVGTQASVKAGLQPGCRSRKPERRSSWPTLTTCSSARGRNSCSARYGRPAPGWMRWHRPILTDSGGFQVFSLGDINRIHDDGVTFKSHLDGSMIELTPERSIHVQNQLGADIIMAMDDCPPPGPRKCPRPRKFFRKYVGEFGREESGPEGAGVRDQRRIVARASGCRTVDALARVVRRRPSAQVPIRKGSSGSSKAGPTWRPLLESAASAASPSTTLPGYAIGGVGGGRGVRRGSRRWWSTPPRLLPADRPR